MKRMQLFLALMLLLMIGINGVMAQGVIIIAPPTATPVLDTDGDGLPDTDDLCPTLAGPRENRGCPPPPNDPPPNNPPPNEPPPANPQPNDPPPGSVPPIDVPPGSVPPSDPPPFTPPSLPTDRCVITPMRDSRVNVRDAADLNASILGNLNAGSIYAADGYVMNGTDVWFRLSVYEGSTGTPGYVSRVVVLFSNCPALPGDTSTGNGAVDDFSGTPPDQPTLCYLSVGYDVATYGSDFDAQLGDESTTYGAFYFESEPGQPILEGTPIWGVVSLDGYNLLPPDSPLHFADPDHAVAVASDQQVIDAAMSGGVSIAFDLAYPNPNGGVMASNGTIFYRLSDPQYVGNCGPIVAIDDLASVPTTDGGTPALVGGWGSSMYQYAFNDPNYRCPDDVIVDGRIITGENPPANCARFTKVTFEPAAEGLRLNLRDTDIGETRHASDGSTTVGYCIYVELYEVGVFNQVCYEIEIPPNCLLTTSEAGVYTVVCEGEGLVELNPVLDGLPALNLTIPPRGTHMAVDFLLFPEGVAGDS